MSDKVVLITGASSGLGEACAEYLATKGHKVYGTSRKSGQTVESYEMIAMDVNDEASVKQAIEYVMQKEGRIDVVVNNAGVGIAGSIEDTSIEEIKFQFETNFFGVLRVCHGVLPIMRQQKSGHIINIASITGLIGIPFQGAYSASKSALQGLTEVLRMEVKPFGVHAVLIEPGDFNTGFTDSRIKTKQAQDSPIYKERFAKALFAMEEDERNGHNPKSVAVLIDRIINTSSPSLRYMIGPRLELLAVHLRKVMPSRLFEWIIMKSFNV